MNRLVLTDFRSYAYQRIEVDDRPVVLTGPNGAGKTNLLEALSLLGPGRGLRRARLGELVRNGADGRWAVSAGCVGPDGTHEIGTGLVPTEPAGNGELLEDAVGRRAVRIDGASARGPSALAEVLALRWLTPQMDRLLAEAAAPRRRFLDRLVFGYDAAHARRVSEYDRALRQRARLLRERIGDQSWLAASEETMAATGVAIAVARRDAAARLGNALETAIGPFPRATIAIQGTLEEWLEEGSALETESRFRRVLATSRERDAASAGAGTGPHRSDLAVRHAETDAPAAQCSTGEQKALLIAILLADARLHTARRGVRPLLLLDEVAAHLDAARREALLAEVLSLGGQAWLTGTERSVFVGLGGNAQWLGVEDSTVSPQTESAL